MEKQMICWFVNELPSESSPLFRFFVFDEPTPQKKQTMILLKKVGGPRLFCKKTQEKKD